MRIIHKPYTQEDLEEFKRDGWWVGIQLECNVIGCQATGVLEWEDRSDLVILEGIYSYKLKFNCPVCYDPEYSSDCGMEKSVPRKIKNQLHERNQTMTEIPEYRE